MHTLRFTRTVDCPACTHPIRVQALAAGVKTTCPGCGRKFGVSAEGGPTWLVARETDEPSTQEFTALKSRDGRSVLVKVF